MSGKWSEDLVGGHPVDIFEPAEMNEPARPSFTRPSPTAMLFFGFLRTASIGVSSLVRMSGASWISKLATSSPRASSA